MSAWANANRNAKAGKEKRRLALERNEFKEQSVPREFPTGPMSFPVKSEDPIIRALIDAKLGKVK